MPLKDLVAKKSEIAESVIEAIVSKYVRYYTDALEIGLTQTARGSAARTRCWSISSRYWAGDM